VADALGMTRVLIHPLAGVLAAYGLGLADIIAMRETAVEAPLSAELLAELPAALAPLEPKPAPNCSPRAYRRTGYVPSAAPTPL